MQKVYEPSFKAAVDEKLVVETEMEGSRFKVFVLEEWQFPYDVVFVPIPQFGGSAFASFKTRKNEQAIKGKGKGGPKGKGRQGAKSKGRGKGKDQGHASASFSGGPVKEE